MKVGRNDPCPCGSGKKYKHCCYATDSVKHEEPVLEAEAAASEEDDAAAEDASAAAQKRDHSRGRDRFHGKSRGGSGSFSPRVFRGSQRGN